MLWDGLQNHTFRHTLFCQDGIPNLGLSETYDEDELFSFDFAQNTRVPRLPDFAAWAQEQGDTPAIDFDKDFCQMLMQQVSPQLEGQIPVSRGQGCGVAIGGCGRGRAGAAVLLPHTSPHHLSPALSAAVCSLGSAAGRRHWNLSNAMTPLSVCILITVPGKTEG